MIQKDALSGIEEILYRPTTWVAVGALVLIASSVAMAILGAQQLHFFNGPYSWSSECIISPFDIGKVVGLFCGAGAGLGAALFIVRKLLAKEMSSWFEEHENVAKVLRFAQVVLALGAIAAAAALFFHLFNYVKDVPTHAVYVESPVGWWNYDLIGSYVSQSGFIDACAGLAGVGAIGMWGVSEFAEILFLKHIAQDKTTHEVIVKSANIETDDL